jgi:hypothetical protein
MKARTWMFGPAALVLALGVTGGIAAKGNAAKTPVRLAAAEKPAKAPKAPKPPTLNPATVSFLERLIGKPLTDDQKQQLLAAQEEQKAAIKAANDKFHEQQAKTLGMTDADLAAKEKDLRKMIAAEKKAEKEKAAPAAAPGQ